MSLNVDFELLGGGKRDAKLLLMSLHGCINKQLPTEFKKTRKQKKTKKNQNNYYPLTFVTFKRTFHLVNEKCHV